jgi:hypothetical protein
MNPMKKLSMLACAGAACATLGMALAQCGGPTFIVQQYAGPPRPKESVAVIRIDDSDTAQHLSLDRERLAPVEKGNRMRIEMLPGMHQIGVTEPYNPSAPEQSLRFRAEAGKVYRVHVARMPEAAGGALAARVYEVDPSSDAPIRDVSLPVAPRGPVERARADAGATEARADAVALPVSDGGIDARVSDAASMATRD